MVTKLLSACPSKSVCVSNAFSLDKGKGNCRLDLPLIKVNSFALLHTGLKSAAQYNNGAWAVGLERGRVEKRC